MNKNIKTCPNCDAYEVKGEYHSLFGCGSYYSDMRMGTPTITEKREGYRFHETLQCAHNRIAVLNIRLRKVAQSITSTLALLVQSVEKNCIILIPILC